MVMSKAGARKTKDKRRSGSRHDLKEIKEKWKREKKKQ